MDLTRTANPRRTTLAALRAGSRCELAAPGCRGTATRLIATARGAVPACSACTR